MEENTAGFRKLPGTALKNNLGETVYTPPQDPAEIVALMGDLERFINEDGAFDADPLVKMAVMHYQFESIHPFYDGNGRTGRILAVLSLVQQGLLDIPVLYLSRHIVRTKPDYYRLLQAVRERDAWEEWMVYMLTAVEETARQTLGMVGAIQGRFAGLQGPDPGRPQVLQPGPDQHAVPAPVHEDRVRGAGPGGLAADGVEVLGGADGGWLSSARSAWAAANYYINVALSSVLTREES